MTINSLLRQAVELVPEVTPYLSNRARYYFAAMKGGDGSGNFGHAGRPGEVGGSAPSGGESVAVQDGGGVLVGSYVDESENEVEITKLNNASTIGKFKGDVAVAIKGDNVNSIISSNRVNGGHAQMVHVYDYKDNIDNYVRFKSYSDNEIIFDTRFAASKWDDGEEKAINNIYRAIDMLTYQGVNQDIKITIRTRTGNEIVTGVKSAFIKTYEYMTQQVERLVRGVYSNNVGGDFIDIIANLISGQFTQAYQQAFEDAGYTDFVLPDYLTASLEAMILNQYDFVDQFFRDIIDARIDGTPIDPLLTRAQMWGGQWNTAYREAERLILMTNGGNLEWVKGATEKGCSTCANLDGIVMSAKEWEMLGVHPRGYPNNKLECEGGGPANNCDCSLVPTDKRRSPNAYGRVEEIIL